MDDIYTSKYLNKKNKDSSKSNNIRSFIKKGLIKCLICAVLFLGGAIYCKHNSSFKDWILDNVYTKNLSFASINNFYNKYLGGIMPFDNIVQDTTPVFNEELVYKEKSKYLDGVKLTVDYEYLVPVLDTGIVVYIGEKEGYGNVIIIQNMQGIDTWYGNIESSSVALYDYIEKGDLLGKVKDNTLYLVYSENNEILNYEDYIE